MNRCEAITLIIKDQCIDRFNCAECSLSDCPYWIALQDISFGDTVDRAKKLYLDPLELIQMSHKQDVEWDDIFKMLIGGED